MNNFSIKKYLIDNNLVNEDGKLICEDSLPNPAWGFGPYDQWKTKIILCSLVHFLNQHCMLDNMIFSLKDVGNQDYSILMDEKERTRYFDFDWGIVIDTIEFLMPHMAGSNISYLGEMIFFNS